MQILGNIFNAVIFVSVIGSIFTVISLFVNHVLRFTLPLWFSFCGMMFFFVPVLSPDVFLISPETQNWINGFRIASFLWACGCGVLLMHDIRVRFRGLLSRYAREGRTVLLSTHIVEDVHQLCGELAVLRKGRLFYAGTSAALLERVKGKIKLLHLENENQLIELQKKSVVLQTTYESRGLTARIMDEDSSFPEAAADAATLEDAYV